MVSCPADYIVLVHRRVDRHSHWLAALKTGKDLVQTPETTNLKILAYKIVKSHLNESLVTETIFYHADA